MSRDFDLGDILSITDGALVSSRHIGGVYDILGYMTGESLMTHQLPRCMDECRPYLLAQHPQLDGVGLPDDVERTQEGVMAWLDTEKVIYGDTLSVEPLAPGQHEYRDALAELDQMAGNRPVIVVHAGEDGSKET